MDRNLHQADFGLGCAGGLFFEGLAGYRWFWKKPVSFCWPKAPEVTDVKGLQPRGGQTLEWPARGLFGPGWACRCWQRPSRAGPPACWRCSGLRQLRRGRASGCVYARVIAPPLPNPGAGVIGEGLDGRRAQTLWIQVDILRRLWYNGLNLHEREVR